MMALSNDTYAKLGLNGLIVHLCIEWMMGVFNSLAPGRPRCHFKTAIFNLVLLIGIFTSSKDNALRWMPRDLTDDKSTLVQVMACCLTAPSHYLSQCWPRFVSPNGLTRPQWVKNQMVPLHLNAITTLLADTTVKCCHIICLWSLLNPTIL